MMDENLLKEFWISRCGECLVINATDNAYKLLGLKEKTNDIEINSIDNYYYIIAFVNFLKNNYTINGLVRESRGNSHDASWEKEITIFNEGGCWKEELDAYKIRESSTYEKKPVVINKNIISKEIIEEWAKVYNLSYNGEDERLIYCSYSDGSDKMIYSIQFTALLGTAIDKMYKYKSNDFTLSPIFLKRIK